MDERYFSPFWVLVAIVVYIAVLLAAGSWAERRALSGRQGAGSGWVYALSLTVYCTSWTYFGSVGSAANSGMLYATVYLGPTVVMLASWEIVRRMIRLRQRYRFSSVVDLLTQRYGQSVSMGAFITLILLLGMVPYIGLQVRALLESFTVITGLRHDAAEVGPWHFTDEAIVFLIGVLTVLFGLRRVDTRERQHGMLMVLAVEAVVKLVAFVAVGVFVTWGVFDGFGDLFARIQADPALHRGLVDTPLSGNAYLTWMTYLVLSMAAIIFLPRMFHVMVVGNHDERHLLTAMWVFPLYLLLISLFVLPIAVGGLLLGYPLSSADWLVIRLPFDRGGPALALLAYLGGFSAAVGMVMVACTTMAIMFSNHIVLPLIDRGVIGERLRGKLRPIRSGVVFLLLAAAYRFQEGLANSYLLIQMGLISFAAVLQFAPAGIGALYWSRGNSSGAWWGLSLGWATWAYTLFLPAVVRSGVGGAEWLENGPWGLAFLRPEMLFGLDLGSPYPNTVFWSLLFNVSGYLIGSLLSGQRSDEAAVAHAYTHAFGKQQTAEGDAEGQLQVSYATVREQIHGLFSRYLPADEAALAIARVQRDVVADGETSLSGPAYLELTAHAERTLAGTIGAAMARKAASEALRLSEAETVALQTTMAEQLAKLKITPQQLREQVDYFRSLQAMSQTYARAMEEKVAALEDAVRERALADASRRESEQRFRSLADSAPVMIWMTSSAYGDCYYNRAWTAFTGASADHQARDGWTLGIHPDDRADALALAEEARERRTGVEKLLRLRRADGEYRHLRVHILPRHAADGTFLGIVGSAVDVSDLLAAEQTLRRSNEELETLIGERTRELQQSYADLQEREQTIRTITDSAQDAVVMVDDAGLVSYWNPAAERMFGWTKGEALGQPLSEFLLPERFRAAHLRAYEGFQRGTPGKILGRTAEMLALHRSGAEIPVDLSLSATMLHGKLHAIGLLRDITERQRAASALRREKAWSEDIIRSAPTMILGLGRSGEIVVFNDYAEQLSGYVRDEVIGKRWIDLFIPPADRDEIAAIIEHAVRTGAVVPFKEHRIVIRDGSERLIGWRSQVMHEDGETKLILSFGVDVTEHRRAEKDLQRNYQELKLLNQRLEEAQNQLLQSEKMASIGQLAAGVAHEINNPVGFVSSNLQTLKTYSKEMLELIAAYQAAEALISDRDTLAAIRDLRQSFDIEFLQEDLPALIRESEEGLLRVRNIVQDLKEFSHVSESEWQAADLNAGLDSTLNVVWNEVKYKARVDKHYGEIPPVECLAAQLNQVFMNLIVNAVQALDESKGMGTITLSTGHQDEWAWVEVKDSGRGMSEDVKRRIFEPFFTTKPIGKGTGLGMSVSYSIVHKHHGRIEVDSAPGHGSRFRVWVPVKHRAADEME
ncbi:MAG TPA: PAS domain S-box protein [Accumulibacter sp.]|uniref:PAS domain S-box protein n=1 Tax=Accumulibacter sp. TaxID=2053492 RepID=UPI002C12D46B|nr:PAS domain S-box protein [Accumulibacter sp.]HRF73012.1 PAS domain S-box protein [Accumulibacter sp.]